MTNTSTISRDSSVDSGIQFAGDGENGGGVTSDSVNLGGSECVTTEDSGEGVKVEKKLDSKTEDQGLGFGDFASDVFSAIANMEGAGGSWLS